MHKGRFIWMMQHPENGGRTFLRNVRINLLFYRMWYPYDYHEAANIVAAWRRREMLNCSTPCCSMVTFWWKKPSRNGYRLHRTYLKARHTREGKETEKWKKRFDARTHTHIYIRARARARARVCVCVLFWALLCPSSGARDYNVDYHNARFVLGLL